jgi:hypothetical protein
LSVHRRGQLEPPKKAEIHTMSKIFAYAVLTVLALAGSMFSCAHGGVSSSNGRHVMVDPVSLTA